MAVLEQVESKIQCLLVADSVEKHGLVGVLASPFSAVS